MAASPFRDMINQSAKPYSSITPEQAGSLAADRVDFAGGDRQTTVTTPVELTLWKLGVYGGVSRRGGSLGPRSRTRAAMY